MPGPGRIGSGLLRVAITTRVSPVHPGTYSALGHSSGPPGVTGNLRQSPHLEGFGQAGAPRRRASRGPADVSGRHSGQDYEEVVGYYPVESPVVRGREHAQAPVYGDTAYPSLGRGPHLRLDRRGLALFGGGP